MTSGEGRVRVFRALMAASVATIALLAAFVPRFLGIDVGEAAPALRLSVYGSAAVLVLLMAMGPALAGRIEAGPGQGDGRGWMITMALTEGITVVGLLSAGLIGQTPWIMALAFAALFILYRVAPSAG